MRREFLITALLVVQVICAALYLVNILSAFTGVAFASWLVNELIELGAALGLFVGVIFGGVLLRRTLRHNREMTEQLRVASGAFMELLEDRFDEWGLTPAERDVALFSIKGCSTAEIAALRQTSEGTVKAQTGAIYRKAGVTGRPQLLSGFIEELMAGPVDGRAVRGATERPASPAINLHNAQG